MAVRVRKRRSGGRLTTSKAEPEPRRAGQLTVAETEPAEALSKTAYRAVLEGLFDRRLAAGAFATQGEIADILNVPIQPLRDALRVLETEGILKIHPRSGIEFPKADLELARSTYQFRSIIERAAVRTFSQSADRQVIVELIAGHKALLTRMENEDECESCKDELQLLERRLHGGLIGILRNPMIETTARRLNNYVQLLRMDVRSTPPIMMQTIREHLAILEGCLARDADAAEQALSQHFQCAMQRLLGMI